MTNIVSGGQVSAVSAGQADIGWTVLSGGILNALSGGTISSTIDSGTDNISTGGTGNSDVVFAGGIENVFGIDTGLTVSSGGTEVISAGGTDQGAQIVGGVQLDYGLASGTTVFSGAQVVEIRRCRERHDSKRWQRSRQCRRH